MTRTKPLLALVAASVVLLVWSNVVVPLLPLGSVLRAVANVAGVLALLAAARAGGLGWSELGVDRASGRAGARWGVAALVAIVAGYAAVLAVSPAVLENPGVEQAGTGALIVRALLLIPLGTVLVEELAFRGVLHALAARAFSVRAAVGLTATVFALWHFAGALAGTGPASGLMPALAVLGVVAVTGAGGVVLGWLRQRTGSVLAPMGLHLGTNSVGLLAAALALR